MLMHHFGSRDELVAMALEVARDRQLAAAEQAIVPGPDAVAVLHATWGWFMRPDTRQYFALFTDVAARERGEPGPERRFTARLGADWQPIFEAVFGADERFARNSSTLALLVVGVLRGMALDLTSGSDTDDHRRAFATLIELIASGGSEE